MYGCKHDPNQVCGECLRAMKDGDAIVIQTQLKPQPGESLDSFQARVGEERRQAGAQPVPAGAWQPPSIEEQKRIIRDPTVPEPVRRFWRETLYGKGTGTRAQQRHELLERQKVKPVREVTPLEALLQRCESGRQRKRLRKFLKRTAKIAQMGGITSKH